jgi:trigger factor
MKYNKEEKDNLICTLSITVEPSDYLPEYKKQLKDVKAKGSFKGFRKGKVPDSFIGKMYGKSILSDVVSKEIDKAFGEIIKKEEINYVAQPLPTSDQELDFDYKDLNKNYEYQLDLGLVSPIQVKGIDGVKYTTYKVSTDQSEIDEHLDNISKTFGDMVSASDRIQEDDVLKVSAKELENGTEKKDGWISSFDIVMKSVGNEDLKKELFTKKKGDTFEASIKDVTNRPESFIRKDLLGVEENDDRVIGDDFSFVIEDVERLKPAELTDELIKEKLSTWNLGSKEELIDDFKKNQTSSYEKDSRNMLFRDIMDSIMDNTEVEISVDFLNRWLKESENVSEDKLAETSKAFKDELKWVKIKELLMKKYDIQITQGEIDAKLDERARTIMMQYGMQDPSLIAEIKKKIAENNNEFYNIVSTVESEKIFSALLPEIETEEKEVGSKEFYDIIDKRFNKKE